MGWISIGLSKINLDSHAATIPILPLDGNYGVGNDGGNQTNCQLLTLRTLNLKYEDFLFITGWYLKVFSHQFIYFIYE